MVGSIPPQAVYDKECLGVVTFSFAQLHQINDGRYWDRRKAPRKAEIGAYLKSRVFTLILSNC
jgi:hypothetical protein